MGNACHVIQDVKVAEADLDSVVLVTDSSSVASKGTVDLKQEIKERTSKFVVRSKSNPLEAEGTPDGPVDKLPTLLADEQGETKEVPLTKKEKDKQEAEAARVEAQLQEVAKKLEAEQEEAAKRAEQEAAAAKESAAKKKAAEEKRKAAQEELNKKLLHACANDDVTAATKLVQKGACVSCRREKDGRTPLLVAAMGVQETESRPVPSDGRLVQFLLNKGADVNARGKRGLSVLNVAANAASPSCRVVELLMAKGAKADPKELKDISMKFAQGVFKTKNTHFPESTLRAWLKIGANVETLRDASSENETPLYIACQTNKPEIVKLLLEFGANMKEQCGAYDITPLNMACSKKHYAVAKVLVDWAAHIKYDVEKEDEDTWAMWKQLEKSAGPRSTIN